MLIVLHLTIQMYMCMYIAVGASAVTGSGGGRRGEGAVAWQHTAGGVLQTHEQQTQSKDTVNASYMYM